MSAAIVSWWEQVTGAWLALLVGAVVCLVLEASGIPDRVAAACYRWAAGGGDGAVLASEVGQPVVALRCLRIFEVGTTWSINLLVLLGALSWLR